MNRFNFNIFIKLCREKNPVATNDYLKNFSLDSQEDSEIIKKALSSACIYCNYSVVKNLLSHYNQHADLQEKTNMSFLLAARMGNLDIVKGLLTDSSLIVNAQINIENDKALINASYQNSTDTVKFLLKSSELKKHCNAKAGNYQAFKSAYKNDNLDLMEYLLNDCNMKVTKPLKKWVNGMNQAIYKYRKETLILLNKYELKNKMNKIFSQEKSGKKFKI